MKDMLGFEVEVGDYVSVGANLGQTACTRIGIVTEVVEHTKKLRVKWTHGVGIPDKPTLVGGTKGYRDTSNFVIIPHERVTAAVVNV